MIRINLLGQARPSKRRGPAVAAGLALPVSLLVAASVMALGFVFWEWRGIAGQIEDVSKLTDQLNERKNQLIPIKAEVEEYEKQRPVLESRKAVIDELKRNRTGGQELLDVVAATVNRTESLWLTGMSRRGGSLTLDGTAASITAVANFITNLKRSGYFDRIEIKESRQDDKNTAVTTFLFSLTADFVLPQSQAPAAPAPGKS